MMDIQQVQLCEAEKQAEPGEFAKVDNDWFRLIGIGRETLGQWLARMVAEGTSTDTTAGIQYTESVEPETFLGSIAPFLGEKEEDAEEAKKYTDGPGKMSFWMKGSKLQSVPTGPSVAWRDYERRAWKINFYTKKELFDAELYTMEEAVEITQQRARMVRNASRQQRDLLWTKIYTKADTLTAIRRLQHTNPGPGQWLAKYIIGRAQQLKERGTEMEIH